MLRPMGMGISASGGPPGPPHSPQTGRAEGPVRGGALRGSPADKVWLPSARREGARPLAGRALHFQLRGGGRHFLFGCDDLLLPGLLLLLRRLFLLRRRRGRRRIGQYHDACHLPLRRARAMAQIDAAPDDDAGKAQQNRADEDALPPSLVAAAALNREAVHQVPIRAVTSPMLTPSRSHKSMTDTTLAYCARASPLIATDILASRACAALSCASSSARLTAVPFISTAPLAVTCTTFISCCSVIGLFDGFRMVKLRACIERGVF